MRFSLPRNIAAVALRRIRSLSHPARTLLTVSAAANAVSWILMLVLLPKGREGVFALRYNVYYGITGIGSAWRLLLIPLFGVALLLGNMLLATLCRRDERAPAAIAGITLFLEVLLLIRSITVFFLNI